MTARYGAWVAKRGSMLAGNGRPVARSRRSARRQIQESPPEPEVIVVKDTWICSQCKHWVAVDHMWGRCRSESLRSLVDCEAPVMTRDIFGCSLFVGRRSRTIGH